MHQTSTSVRDVEHAEDGFFAALLDGDADRTARHLDEEFLLVDVSSGAVSDRDGLVDALRDGVVAFDRLELVVCGGAPLPAETMALWHMYGVNVVEIYGQTEGAGGIIAGQRGPFPPPGTVGTVPQGWDVKLGADGEVLVATYGGDVQLLRLTGAGPEVRWGFRARDEIGSTPAVARVSPQAVVAVFADFRGAIYKVTIPAVR